MAKKRQVALVIVSSEWFTSAGVRRFFGGEQTPRADVSQYVIAPLVNDQDPIGLWIGEMTTKAVRRIDGKDFTMKFMIPWSHVLGLGVIDESERRPIGFEADPTTIVIGARTEK